MEATLNLTAPDDFHVHLRDGELLEHVCRYTSGTFRRALVMPNARSLPDESSARGIPFLQGLLGEPEVASVASEEELAEILSCAPSVQSASQAVIQAYGHPRP